MVSVSEREARIDVISVLKSERCSESSWVENGLLRRKTTDFRHKAFSAFS